MMANTVLPDNQEVEAITQCEKEAREPESITNKSNRSARVRVSSLMQEVNEGARESVAIMTLPDDQEGEATTQCEKE